MGSIEPGSRLLAVGVAVVLGALTSCGDSSPCSPSTCAGCCGDGVCHSGDAVEACGRGGVTCLACTPPTSCGADGFCEAAAGGGGGGAPIGGGNGGAAGSGGGGGGTAGAGGGLSCTNSCFPLGKSRCNGSLVQTCNTMATGCLGWSTPIACFGGLSCMGTACPPDPCNGVPTTGVCTGTQTYSFCGTATGQSAPSVIMQTCPTGTACTTASGVASCQNTGACTPGTSACLDATHLQSCNGGALSTTACAHSCIDTALGGFCTPVASTMPVNLTVQYTTRGPNSNYTDWSTTTSDVTIGSLLVVSLSGTNVLDAKTTDPSGNVTLQVPTAPQPGDLLRLVAAASDGAGGLAFMVGDPGFASSGTQPINTVGTPSLWHWDLDSSTMTDGGVISVSEADGSGALRVFDYLRYSYYNAMAEEGGRPGKSLLVWLGFGTAWECGSCFAPFPTTFSGLPFASQIWLGADTADERWWSDAVTAHELGHWVMASYGVSPNEGGKHIIGVPTYPGMAWSEGWATWHSSDARLSSIYYDKQNGSMFWVDLATASYSSPTSWQPPTPSGGLLQMMDENEVAAMLWSISNDASVGEQALFSALASARMTHSPWARGYTRHQWSQLDSSGNPLNAVDTHTSAPCVADMLDALICSGAAASVIDTATVPATQYPFPSGSPLCQ